MDKFLTSDDKVGLNCRLINFWYMKSYFVIQLFYYLLLIARIQLFSNVTVLI